MRQTIELAGPGASLEELAAALGVTPERQAAIRHILGVRPQEPAPQSVPEKTLGSKKRRLKKPSARRQPV